MTVICSPETWFWNLGVQRSCASFSRVRTLSNSASLREPLPRLTTLSTFSNAPSRPWSSQRCRPSRSSSLRIRPSESRSMLSYTSFRRSGLRSKSFSSTFSRKSLMWTSPPLRSASSTCSTSLRNGEGPESMTRRHQKSARDSTSSRCCIDTSKVDQSVSEICLTKGEEFSRRAVSSSVRLSRRVSATPGVPGCMSGTISTEPKRDRGPSGWETAT
mmetsp:Transcript_117747/g.379981  ORF Transcript_117747/g.379981 Transcript_117747/m.379981 type:complete len:216 (-) Transcript_117747:337-984(-)